MKKSFAVAAVILAVFSMLYFSGTALAGKAYLGSVGLSSESGTKSSMTFNYTHFVNFNASTQRVQVSNATSFSSPIEVVVGSSTQTSGVDCTALTSGQAYWRIIELDGDSKINISEPQYLGFTLPN
jgi:hypothetical protein